MNKAEAPEMSASPFWLKLAATIEGGLDRVACSRAASLAAIVLVALICVLPGFFTLPPIDRDEPRFAQATHQMVETGNYFDIRFQDEARYKKPIGIYWLQSAAVWLTGTGPDAPIAVYRLASLFGILAASCLTWWLAMAFGRPRLALLAGLLLASTVLVGVEARLAKTDAVLLATIVAAHGALVRAWLADTRERSFKLAAIFWTALGVSILIKGPVGVGAILCPVVVLSIVRGSFSWLKRLAPLPGFIWMLIVVLPWFVAIGIASKGAFFQEALGRDLLGKVSDVQESHGAPPGAYLLTFFFTFWPVAAYFSTGFGWVLDQLKRPTVLYAMASVVPFWLAVEAMATKLPHYVLPLYPLIALVTADVLDSGGIRRGFSGWFARFAASGAALFPLALAIAAIVIAILLHEAMPIFGIAILIVAIAVGVASGRLFRISALASAMLAIATAALTYAGTLGVILPSFDMIRISENLVRTGRSDPACPDPDFASAGFDEPSLVFVGGTNTLLVDGERAANFLGGGTCRVAFIEKRQLSGFSSRADDLGLTLKPLGVVKGYNINGGRMLELNVFLRGGAAP
ncbi:glycosyltransferase family 39 protein [Kaistia dalseonensis]|uniref:4-amino-4-deoxy-L-arabinose transferase-like glycosyltransferase n=1 Tax=Kaistia dalseonensis TaxID=410840 RepID=A0ABU0H1N1_9HYPH|nr:glycosyltransferase family 39 protein [Kaistia dalseonensis]MCX5493658.1 glycosyltransferase family 39 protein [Kaistia dalseonensis]MDQ0436220.1 4-amino-4-deoxy-L-arabinose transferase-like glycosyltransferase [Kaistia dalseonensis]